MSFYAAFAPYYEQVFPFREEVFRFLRSSAGVSGSAILDAGCGPGHYCGRFASEGYSATGIDFDAAMIESARLRYPEAKFLWLDIRNIDRIAGAFSCIYSIGNVVAHLSRVDLPFFIRKVYGKLASGGIWVMQVIHWDALLGLSAYEFPATEVIVPEGKVRFERRYGGINRDGVAFTFSLHRQSETIFSETVTLYPVSSGEYLKLHEAEGFELLGLYSDFSHNLLREEPGSGLVMVFRKGKIMDNGINARSGDSTSDRI